MSFRPESENYKFWTKEEDEKITELASIGTPIKEISKILNRSYISCASRCSILKVKNRYCGPKKYTQNENFWSEPNPINCYYAGIIAADGNLTIYKRKFEYFGYLRWELHSSDVVLLEDFKRVTEFTGPIHFSEKRNHNRILISSESWNKDLIEKFNIVENKTYRIKPPNNINDQLFFCWLIGYIDGDGTVTIHKRNGYLHIKLNSCSEYIIKYIYEFLKKCFPSGLRKKAVSIPRKLKNINCWEISLIGIRAMAFFSYVKQYNLPKLDRKWKQEEVLKLEEDLKNKYPKFFDFSHLPPPV